MSSSRASKTQTSSMTPRTPSLTCLSKSDLITNEGNVNQDEVMGRALKLNNPHLLNVYDNCPQTVPRLFVTCIGVALSNHFNPARVNEDATGSDLEDDMLLPGTSSPLGSVEWAPERWTYRCSGENPLQAVAALASVDQGGPCGHLKYSSLNSARYLELLIGLEEGLVHKLCLCMCLYI